ncbi:YncE family protein, partial [Candidatus Bathyarchaeota archaeon]
MRLERTLIKQRIQATRRHTLSTLLVFSFLILSLSSALIISVFAPSGIRVVATVTVGASPTEDAFDPAINDTYVANYQNASVSVISRSNTLLATISGFAGPRSPTFCPFNNNVYVANSYLNDTKVISSSTNSVIADVIVGFGPWAVIYDPHNHNIYTANPGNNSVAVINT